MQIFPNNSRTEYRKLYSFLLLGAVEILSLIVVCFVAISPPLLLCRCLLLYMLSVMCSLLRLVSRNITLAFFFASLTQRLSEMWEKKCDFTLTINKSNSNSLTGKGLSTLKERQKSRQTSGPCWWKRWLLSPIVSVCLMWLVQLDAFATMRELLPECPWNSRAVTDHPTHSSKISYNSGRNTGLLTYIWNEYVLMETTNKSLLCTASRYILRRPCVCVCVCARACVSGCIRALFLDANDFHPGCCNSHFDQVVCSVWH